MSKSYGTMDHFLRSIERKKFMPLEAGEIDRIVDTIYLEGEPLLPLSAREIESLRAYTRVAVEKHVNSKQYAYFAEGNFYRFSPDDQIDEKYDLKTWAYPSTLVQAKCHRYGRVAKMLGKSILSKEEKMELVHDPLSYYGLHFYGRDKLCGYGHRSLLHYGTLPFQMWPDPFPSINIENPMYTQREVDEAFLHGVAGILDRLRSRTGKKVLHVLDVGGGQGRALHDLQALDPDIVTHNLTMEEHTAMFDVDHLHLRPAERMPADFEERMDLVISNVACRYMLYFDAAYRNVLAALAPGGEAFLDRNDEDCPLPSSERRERYASAMGIMERLRARGLVSVDRGHIVKHERIPLDELASTDL